MSSTTEWLEEPGVEYWKAEYKFEWVFRSCTRELFANPTQPVVKLLSKPFGDNRWQISVGTIAKTPGYLGVFLGAAQDTELKTSKTWIRRCETCTATLGTPEAPGIFGKEKNISGGYTFNAGLESRRGQAKYIKLDKLFVDDAFKKEQALFVQVTLCERRRTTEPSPFGDIARFAGSSARFSNLFDDPDCSDVCFVFPQRKGKRGARTIYAQKYIIRSVPYFNTMFESGFLESSDALSQADSVVMDGMSISPTFQCPNQLEDEKPKLGADEEAETTVVIDEDEDSVMAESTIMGVYDEDDSDFELDDLEPAPQSSDDLTLADIGNSFDSHHHSHSLPPTKKRRFSEVESRSLIADNLPRKGVHRIVITTTPYTTYRALLLYIYSNSIAWAPLKSNWLVHKERIEQKGRGGVVPSRHAFVREQAVKFSLALTMKDLQPTSPKSMYVLADILQLPELRQEALEQFKRSLNSENACMELISSFVGKYDQAREILFQFIRSNWEQITTVNSFMSLWDEGFRNASPSVRSDWAMLMSQLKPITVAK